MPESTRRMVEDAKDDDSPFRETAAEPEGGEPLP